MFELDKNKKELRKQYIELRKNIHNKDLKSDIIFNKIINLEEYKSSKTIAIYKSMKDEINTKKLIEYSFCNKKTVVLPRVEGNNMDFYKINSLYDKFETSKLGVEEPISDINNIIEPSKIDLIIVPGICFDIYKNRLGFGKGFYDRFLCNTKIKKIAICFEEQIMKNTRLPITNNDIKMDIIVTDGRIINGGKEQ